MGLYQYERCSMKKFSKSLQALFLALLFTIDVSASNDTDRTKTLTSITTTSSSNHITKARKDWNLLIYMAANNNLHAFALNNIEQMKKVGSTDNINVLVQFDELGGTNVCRYFVEKNKLNTLDAQSHNIGVTTGTPESLFNFIKWGIETFPANHQAVILWNHGSGIKDPSIWGKFLLKHRDELYIFNDESKLFELNHQIIKHKNIKNIIQHQIEEDLVEKGIAFNDTFHTYLTNQDLKYALEDIVNRVLGGKKIDLLCMDACLMAMVEIGDQVKNAVKFMVCSQEVEPGGGYQYKYVLKPFIDNSLTPEEFAKHVVAAYQKEYAMNYAEYTQSAFNLDEINPVESDMFNLTQSLISLVKASPETYCKLIKKIRNSTVYTQEFYDTDYIDLCTFLNSLNQLMSGKDFANKIKPELAGVVNCAITSALSCLNNMQNLIIKNTYGPLLKNAFGAAIYFPKRNLHPSYFKTVFDQNTKWSQFLTAYLTTKAQMATDKAQLKARDMQEEN